MARRFRKENYMANGPVIVAFAAESGRYGKTGVIPNRATIRCEMMKTAG